MSIMPYFIKPLIGIDVGSRLIKAAQLGHKRGEVVVTATASIGRSHPDAPLDRDEVMRLERVLSQQGFKGRSVVLATAGERMMSSVIDMPPRDSGAPYDLIATQEFARLQRLEPGEFEMAWWHVPRPARASGAKVMVVGCAHSDSNPLVDVFTQCGFDVVALDSGLCAAVRACNHLLEPADSISGLLDMGWNSARLALVHGSVVVFDRVLSGSGMSALQARICKSLGIEPAEAEALIQNVGLVTQQEIEQAHDARVRAVAPLLRPNIVSYLNEIVQELHASFEYAMHQYPDAVQSRLVLVGGGGATPGVAQYLAGRVSPQVMSAQLPQINTTDTQNSAGTDSALMAAALGLANYDQQG